VAKAAEAVEEAKAAEAAEEAKRAAVAPAAVAAGGGGDTLGFVEGPGPPGAVKLPSRFHCKPVLYGASVWARAGRLTAKNGGSPPPPPGQTTSTTLTI
jgi:hypothetical protein